MIINQYLYVLYGQTVIMRPRSLKMTRPTGSQRGRTFTHVEKRPTADKRPY